MTNNNKRPSQYEYETAVNEIKAKHQDINGLLKPDVHAIEPENILTAYP